MENLVFSLNATMPIFLTMLIGLALKKLGLFSESFVNVLNKFVFTAALPALLFQDISSADFYDVWDGKFALFCFCATLICIFAAMGLSFLLKNKALQGEFIQASYRSSAAILGIAFIQNIYGNSGMAPLMIIATVPLYNVMAVVTLSFFRPSRGKFSKGLLLSTLRGIVTNPIILGILAGMLWSVLRIPKPVILDKTVENLGCLATPLGLMAMGASFEYNKAFSNIKPALCCSVLKLFVFCAVFLPLAVLSGFRQEALIAILVMLGSSTTVSCFIMAKNMGYEGTLTSSAIMITTFFSAFTLTGWLYLLKTLALI